MYWDCQKLRQKKCTARAITNDPKLGQAVVLYEGPTEWQLDHPPNREEVATIQLSTELKLKAAAANPSQPSS